MTLSQWLQGNEDKTNGIRTLYHFDNSNVIDMIQWYSTDKICLDENTHKTMLI